MTIADSGSLRTTRWKQHKAGDHSLCRNCAEKRFLQSVPVEGRFLEPSDALRDLARRLEAAHVAAPDDAAVARELRMTLQVLMGAGSGRGNGDGNLAELFEAFGSA